MEPEQFRALESALAANHAQMADQLGISEISVKRYATGTQPIPGHIAKLSLALMLIVNEGLQKKFDRALAKYHNDT